MGIVYTKITNLFSCFKKSDFDYNIQNDILNPNPNIDNNLSKDKIQKMFDLEHNYENDKSPSPNRLVIQESQENSQIKSDYIIYKNNESKHDSNNSRFYPINYQ